MMKIVEYKTVNAISGKELDNAVNRQIQLGLQPLGSPYVVGSGSTQTIFQAMVKMEAAHEPERSHKKEHEKAETHGGGGGTGHSH